MKKIETVIHARNWQQTREVLEAHRLSATLREIKTFGRTPPKPQSYRGVRYVLETTPELELTAVVRDEMVDSVVQALMAANSDAEVQVSSVERIVRRREQGPVPMPRASTVRAVAAPSAAARAVHS